MMMILMLLRALADLVPLSLRRFRLRQNEAVGDCLTWLRQSGCSKPVCKCPNGHYSYGEQCRARL